MEQITTQEAKTKYWIITRPGEQYFKRWDCIVDDVWDIRALIRIYSEQKWIWKARYVVNFSNGTNQDLSIFMDIRIFSNKKEKDSFVKKLQKDWYIYS